MVSVKEADLKNEIISILCKHAEVIFGRYIHLERSVSSDTTADELREINRNLDKDGRMLRSLYESLIGELITRDEFAAMKAEYQAKIETLSRQADEIRNRRYQAKSRTANYSRKADAVSEVLCEDHLTANHIDMLIREIQ